MHIVLQSENKNFNIKNSSWLRRSPRTRMGDCLANIDQWAGGRFSDTIFVSALESGTFV